MTVFAVLQGDAAWQEQVQLNQHNLKALVLTVWPQNHWITVREVSQLPLAKFANLYTVRTCSGLRGTSKC